MFNLKQKLMIVGILPVVLTLSVIVVAAESIGKRLSYDSFEQKAAAQFLSVAGALEGLFKSHVKALELIANSEFVRSGSDEDRLAFLREQYKFFRDQSVESLYLTRLSGQVDGIFGERFNVRDREYFPTLLAGKTVITSIERSRATQKPIILFIVPVFDQTNQVVGGIGSTIPAEDLAKLIIETIPNDVSFAILRDIDTQRILVATKAGRKDFGFRAIDDFLREDAASGPATLASVMGKRAQGVAEWQYGGRSYVSYFSPLPGLRWSLALSYPKASVFSLVNRIRDFLLMALAISTGLMFFSTTLLFRHVISPIQQMIAGFAELSRGNLHAAVPVTNRTDEIAKLARAFNATVRDLRQSFEERETAVSDKEDLLRIIDTTPDYIAIANDAWQVVYFNPAAAEMIKSANRDVGTITITDFFTHDYRDVIVEKAVAQAMRTGIWEGETQVSNKDGELIALSQVIMCHRRKDGSHFFSMTARNISRQKRVEQETLLAKERMETAMRSQNVFMATISHELMTPLSGIVNGLESLDSIAMDDDERQILTITRKAADKLQNILSRIVQFVDIVSGKFQASTTLFRIDEVLRSAIQPLTERIQGKGLTLRTDISPQVSLDCRGDRYIIQEIILTLVDNAIKFSFEGEVKVSIDALRKKGQMQILKIQVSDNGIGISRENLDRIFDPFYQIDSTLTREYEGLGLGLAYCKKLVQLLNGEIAVDSTLGQGSCFSVTLPLEMVQAVDHDRESFGGIWTTERISPAPGHQQNIP